jgi:predicted RNase H-like nuclease
MSEAWRYVGVDRDAGSWIAVGYPDAGPPSAAVFDTVDDLWRAHGGTVDRVVVDVPVGLCGGDGAADGCVETDGERSRRCDDLARRVVGPRSSSVFTAPCRAAARAAARGEDYRSVSDRNRERTGKGLTRQAANLAPAIVEVEDLLLSLSDPTALIEGHPEVCFRALSGDVLRHAKTTAPGMAERLAALEATAGYDPGTWRRLAASLGAAGHDAGADDLLDALSLAVTAMAPDGAFHTLPADPPTDAEGLPMAMGYRRREPFEVG